MISGLDVSLLHVCCWIKVQQGYDLYPHGIYRGYSTKCKTVLDNGGCTVPVWQEPQTIMWLWYVYTT